MRVELIEDQAAIAALRPQWQAVYQADPEARFFLSFEWQFGTAASIGCDAFVLAVRAAGGTSDYVAFLPIRLVTASGSRGYYNELHLTGNKTSDYNGFICRSEFEETAIPALASALRKLNWRRLSLRYIPASDTRLKLFLSAFSAKEVTLERLGMIEPDGVDISVCPYAELGGDFDSFLQRSTSANTRQKIRRYLRRVESSPDYRITHTTAETLETGISTLNRLWAIKWGESKGKRLDNILRTHWHLLRSAFDTDTLFMPVLWHRDRPVSIFAILVDRQKKVFNFFVGARDLSFTQIPSGLVMHGYSIRHAISEGFVKYDFLRGNEPYKYSFATGEEKIRSVLISTKSGTNLGGALDMRCLREVFARSKESYRAGDLPAAGRGFAQILQQLPGHGGAAYLTGLTAARMADHKTACLVFSRLLERTPGSLKMQLRQKTAEIAGLRPAQVPETAGAGAQGRVPGGARGALLLGRALLRLDHPGHAAAVLEAARSRHPADPALAAALAAAQRSGKAAMARKYEKRIQRQIRIDAIMGKTPAVFGGVERHIPAFPGLNAADLGCLGLLTMPPPRAETALTGVLAGAGLPG